MNESTLITKQSPYDVKETADRVEHVLREQHIVLFGRINHAQAAHDVGLEMQPEELLIFGSPKAGTPLMVERPEIGIELPLKIIVWQGETSTMIGCHNLEKLFSGYNLVEHKQAVVKLQAFLQDLITTVVNS